MSTHDGNQEYGTGGRNSTYILVICTLLYMVNFMDRQVLSAVLQPMKIELGLTDAECGLVQTVFILGVALFTFPLSYLMDRWNRKKPMAIMAILWSVFTYVTGLATSFISLIIPRALVGVGEAGFSSGGTAMISGAYPKEKRGRVLGIFTVAVPLGAVIGTIAGGMLSAKFGWRMPFFLFAIPGIILGIMALFMRDYKVEESSVSQNSRKDIGSSFITLLKIPTLHWLYLGLGISTIMINTFLSWMPALIMRVLNVNESTAGLIVGGMGMMALIGAPLGGWLTDLWHRHNPRGRVYLPAIALASAAVVLIAAIMTGFNTLGIVLGMLYGILNVMAVPAFGAISQDVVPAAHKGFSFGLAVFFQYMLGGAWAPWVVGIMSDALGGGASGLSTAITVATAFGIIGGACFYVASRHYVSDVEKAGQDKLVTSN
jgi:MFS family permease